MATLLDYLRELRALFSDPARHATGALARDAKGMKVDFGDEAAVCWCLLGGCQKITPDGLVLLEVYNALLEARPTHLSHLLLSDLNDMHPGQVLPLIDRAIERAS